MGIVGTGLVAIWAYGLPRDTGRVLLDAEQPDDFGQLLSIHEELVHITVEANQRESSGN